MSFNQIKRERRLYSNRLLGTYAFQAPYDIKGNVVEYAMRGLYNFGVLDLTIPGHDKLNEHFTGKPFSNRLRRESYFAFDRFDVGTHNRHILAGWSDDCGDGLCRGDHRRRFGRRRAQGCGQGGDRYCWGLNLNVWRRDESVARADRLKQRDFWRRRSMWLRRRGFGFFNNLYLKGLLSRQDHVAKTSFEQRVGNRHMQQNDECKAAKMFRGVSLSPGEVDIGLLQCVSCLFS